jgi:hypothetical protein
VFLFDKCQHVAAIPSLSFQSFRQVHQASEIVLCRVAAGESCLLTTACLLAYENYRAEGIAETDVRAVVIPRGPHRRSGRAAVSGKAP